MSSEEIKDKFVEKGLTFRIATKKDKKDIWICTKNNFFKDEPISRSLGADRNQTLGDKMIRSMFKDVLGQCLKQDISLVVEDKDGKIVAFKLCHSHKLSDKEPPQPSLAFLGRLLWMLPRQYAQLHALDGHFRKLNYNTHHIMREVKSDKIFVGEILCVSNECRGLGLGRELIQRTLELAKKDSCSHYMALVTGIYSQKVFRDLGFKVLYSGDYAEMKDKYGEEIMHDRREHTHAETIVRAVEEEAEKNKEED